MPDKKSETIEVNDDTIADEAKKHKIFIIDCWAPGCTACVTMFKMMDKLSKHYKGEVIFAKINVDENKATAEKYGITEFPTPAGGCLLTEPHYSNKLRDLMNHSGILERRDVELLSIGRHLRLTPSVKIVVGRNEGENNALRALLQKNDYLLFVIFPAVFAFTCSDF